MASTLASPITAINIKPLVGAFCVCDNEIMKAKLTLSIDDSSYSVPVNLSSDDVANFFHFLENRPGEISEDQKAFETAIDKARMELQNDVYFKYNYGRYGSR